MEITDEAAWLRKENAETKRKTKEREEKGRRREKQ
jgi:hypothetical protein